MPALLAIGRTGAVLDLPAPIGYVPDCDAVFDRCVAAGATALDAVTDQFWGDRAGKIRDPFGVAWMIMTHKEDVSPEEMQSRFAAMTAGPETG